MTKTLLLLLAGAAIQTQCSAADEGSRAGRFETFVTGQYISGDKTVLEDTSNLLQIQMRYDAFIGAGFGVGYNLTDHFNVNANINLGAMDGAAGNTWKDTDPFVMNFNLGVDYNLLASRLTPLLNLGIGFNMFEDEFQDPATNIFWKYEQANFAIGGGIGLRWEFSDHVFFRALYRANWNVGMGDFKDPMVFHEITASVGYMF